jgi:hypothetical protein
LFKHKKFSILYRGAVQYALQLTLIRWKVYIKYSYTKIDLIKITCDEKEGNVQVRWRINAMSGLKAMLKPWKMKFWKINKTQTQQELE